MVAGHPALMSGPPVAAIRGNLSLGGFAIVAGRFQLAAKALEVAGISHLAVVERQGKFPVDLGANPRKLAVQGIGAQGVEFDSRFVFD